MQSDGGVMEITSITLYVFTVLSAARIFSYIPQICKIASDPNGATAISYSTWSLWTAANISTALYAAVNLQDVYLGSISLIYASCCITVIGLTIYKQRAARTTLCAAPISITLPTQCGQQPAVAGRGMFVRELSRTRNLQRHSFGGPCRSPASAVWCSNTQGSLTEGDQERVRFLVDSGASSCRPLPSSPTSSGARPNGSYAPGLSELDRAVHALQAPRSPRPWRENVWLAPVLLAVTLVSLAIGARWAAKDAHFLRSGEMAAALKVGPQPRQHANDGFK